MNYYNPVAQFTIRFTQPLVKPLQYLLPSLKGFDLAVILLALIIEIIKLIILSLFVGMSINPLVLIVYAIGDVISKILNIYFYLIIIRVIISWFQPNSANPLYIVLIKLTEPVMSLARRILPPIRGLDFSPILVIILIMVIERLVSFAFSRFVLNILGS